MGKTKDINNTIYIIYILSALIDIIDHLALIFCKVEVSGLFQVCLRSVYSLYLEFLNSITLLFLGELFSFSIKIMYVNFPIKDQISKLSSDWDWDLGPGTWDLGPGNRMENRMENRE